MRKSLFQNSKQTLQQLSNRLFISCFRLPTRATTFSQQSQPSTRWIATAFVISAPFILNQYNKPSATYGGIQSLSQQIWGHAGLTTTSAAECSPQTEEIDIGTVDQFVPGDLYEVKIHNGKDQVLISSINGKLYCTGNSCSHYSAPLHRGVPSTSNTVQCPWHDAEFDLETGKCIGGCGLKGIPVYPVDVRDGHVYIKVPIEGEIEDSVDIEMAKRDPKNHLTIGIVGAGAAGLTTAETLRQEGFTGRILMFGQESYPPYDRPVLSKNLNAKIDKLLLRTSEWLESKAMVEFLPNAKVVNVDVGGKTILTEGGQSYKCDKIVIATGGVPRRLLIPGCDLKNIEVLRSFDDMKRIAAYGKLDQNIVIVGSSFIGMELAATLSKSGANVTIVGMEKVPFERVLGEKIGRRLLLLVNQKKVTFRGLKSVVQFRGHSGKVTGVELDNGDILQADLVVLGVGVVPNTEMVHGICKLGDRSLKVDPFMQIKGCKDVYAVGDIATFPYYKTGEDIRVEHWNVAMQQGRIAAKHIMGKMIPYDSIPFFWTMILGKSIRYAGYCVDPDDIVIEGNVDEMNFAALYVKNNLIQAVATCGKDPAAVAAAEVMKRNILPDYVEYEMGLLNTDLLVCMAKEHCGKEL